MTALTELSALTTSDAKQRRLYAAGCTLLGAVMVYYFLNAKVVDFIGKVEGLAILFLAVYPSLDWVKSTEKRFPIIEVLMLTTANSYAFPILNGHEEAVGYPLSVINLSAWVVLAFQLSVLFAYKTTKGLPKLTPFWTEELISQDVCRYLSYGVAMDTIYLALSDYTSLIPPNLDSLFRAACFGISIVCTFISAQLWGAGELRSTEKSFFLLNLALQTVLQTVNLFMVGVVSTMLLAILGYVTSSKRVPLAACTVILAFVAVLHNGEPAMRAEYWHEDVRLVPPIPTLPAFYTEWIGYGFAPPAENDEDTGLTSKLLQRTSLFQMICLVANASPDHLPFLDGDTYSDVLAQFVPRFLWPDKPNGLRSTFRLSVYYGLQSDEGTATTTIAFGQVAEAYANFGFPAVVALGLLTGMFYRKIQTWAAKSPIISFAGILMVVLMAWSFQTEFTLSTWIASLYQACLCLYLMLTVARYFLR